MINQLKTYILIGAVVAIPISATFAYLQGKSTGKAEIQAQLDEEKKQWESIVKLAQLAHEESTKEIHQSYQESVALYKKEIDRLKRQPPKVIAEIVEVYIPKEVDTTIPKGFVDLHNTAAKGLPLSDTSANSSEPSDKVLSDVGKTVAANYYQCLADKQKLESLQLIVEKFIQEQNELIK